MDEFDRLVREAARVPAGTWDFSWLDGRAVEERPRWRYFERVAERVATVGSLLEHQAGTGAMISNLLVMPERSVATEGYPPSPSVAASRLRAVGVGLVAVSDTDSSCLSAPPPSPWPSARHPVEVWWPEIARVLRPGGIYFAKQSRTAQSAVAQRALLGPAPGHLAP